MVVCYNSTLFQRAWTTLYSYQQCMKNVPVTLHPHHFVCTVRFFTLHSDRFAALSNCGFYLHFLVANVVEHLFICLFAICIFFGEAKSFAHFKIGFPWAHGWLSLLSVWAQIVIPRFVSSSLTSGLTACQPRADFRSSVPLSLALSCLCSPQIGFS